MTDSEAYRELTELLKERRPGWDSKAKAIIIDRLYGDVESLITACLPILRRRMQLDQ
jgi:hypothetical protein